MPDALLPAIVLAAWPLAAHAQMVHPAGMTHQQVIDQASAAAPAAISQTATIAWADSAGAMHVMRPGTSGFTCVILVPDVTGGPICGDDVAMHWVDAMLTHKTAPPQATRPGIAYMGRGGSHFEDAHGNLSMEPGPNIRTVHEPPHWMLIYPFDPATSGLSTRPNQEAYIMFAGSPWAHVMVYQDPRGMATPAAHATR